MPRRRAAKANTKTKKRRPLRFHQREAERLMRAVRKMGLPIGRVDVDPTGRISIATVKEANTDQTNNPWDEVLTDATDEERPA